MGPNRCYGLMYFEQAVYFPASCVLTAEQGLPAGSRITLWKTGNKTDHTEWLGLGGTSGEHLVQPTAKAGSPTAGCTGLRPGGFRIAPEKETPCSRWELIPGRDSSLWLQHGCLSCRFPPWYERRVTAEHEVLLVTNGSGTAARGVVVVRT